MTHIQVQNSKVVLVMSLKYTSVTQSILCLIFLMYARIIQHFTMMNKNLKNILQFIILTHVTLKQGQGQQNWYKLVDPEQDYNNAKFEKPNQGSQFATSQGGTFTPFLLF